MRNVLLILANVFIFFGCTNTGTGLGSLDRNGKENSSVKEGRSYSGSLVPLDFVSWVKDGHHGLNKEKTIGDIRFAAQYKPLEYVICMEERTEQVEDSLVKRKVAELKDMQYIDFKIALTNSEGELLKYNLSSLSQYEERVNYFSYKMQNDIKLVEGKDTLDCALFHFERAYDVAPYSVFVLGFPLGKGNAETKTLVYHDNMFKKGIIKLEFEKGDLNTIPNLATLQ